MHMPSVYDFLTSAAVYGLLGYLARTIPVVNNKWINWIAGGFQYILSNPDKASAHMSAASTEKQAGQP